MVSLLLYPMSLGIRGLAHWQGIGLRITADHEISYQWMLLWFKTFIVYTKEFVTGDAFA